MLKTALTVLAMASSSPAPAPETTTVSVTLTGLKSTDGTVLIGLCDEAGWETFKCDNARLTPNPEGVSHTFEDVSPGTYGITVLHDENNNGKMDFRFLGPPKEQWGSSNNPPPRMGRSRWKDVAFEVGSAPVTTTIGMQ